MSNADTANKSTAIWAAQLAITITLSISAYFLATVVQAQTELAEEQGKLSELLRKHEIQAEHRFTHLEANQN